MVQEARRKFIIGVMGATIGALATYIGLKPSLARLHGLEFAEKIPWEKNLLRALKFLLESQYNPNLKLCREGTQGVAASTYWLLSDNLLASKVFQYFRLHDVSDTISRELTRRNWIRNNFHEILFGLNIDFPPRVERVIEVEAGPNYRILTEYHDGAVFSDYDQYADLSIYGVLHHLRNDAKDLALEIYNNVLSMWDGLGLRDKVAKEKNIYSTYKLALLLYASSLLEKNFEFRSDLENRIWNKQQRDDGGIITDYDINGFPTGDANTETTSLSILAYTNSYKPFIH